MRALRCRACRPRFLIAALAIASILPAFAAAQPIEPVTWGQADPLPAMLRRIDRYFQRTEIDGVVLDWRVVINATEAARLSVMPQLLGYEELHKIRPTRRFRRDIVERADYLVDRFDEFRSGSVFDGMFGLSLLEAYDVVPDPRYLAKGVEIVDEIKALPPSERILNGGLMGAMVLAKYYAMTGDSESAQLAHEVIASLPLYQNPDGSFPHWCGGSTDVHYTDWMTMELIIIQRLLDDPGIGPLLQSMQPFLEQRMDEHGVTRYEEPCPDYPGCMVYYYSIATGCGIDYDTRAFTNELGYTALMFDHVRSPEYQNVMHFMRTLERGGTFADKWDFWPPPDDPYYVWTTAETSVVNTSMIFWSLSSALSGRVRCNALASWDAFDPELENEPASAGEPRPAAANLEAEHAEHAALRIESIAPNPSRGGCTIRFTLPGTAPVSLAVYDAQGRRVRALMAGTLGPGAHAVQWDRSDDAGREVRSGLYFLRLQSTSARLEGADSGIRTARVLLVR